MSPLEQLIAMEEIRQVKARYFRLVDTKDWDGFARLFTPDVVLERTYSGSIRDPWTGEWSPPLADEPVLVRGLDSVIARVRLAVEDLITVHRGYMPEITFDDDDTARAIWAMDDELRDRQGRLVLAGRGHYHETYRRTPEGWRIAAFRITRLTLQRGGE